MRYAQAAGVDAAGTETGDTGFVGVDARRAPQLLEAGIASGARNLSLRFGRAEPRGGFSTVWWAADRLLRWPVTWRPEPAQRYLTTSLDDQARMNYRLHAGQTLQLRQVGTDRWHSVWLEGAELAPPTWVVDPVGMAAEEWTWAPWDEMHANVRFLWGETLQIRNLTTGMFHTVWLGPGPTLVVDEDGMAPEETPVALGAVGYQVGGGTTLQLIHATTGEFHALWVNAEGGLSVDEDGVAAESQGDSVDLLEGAGFGDVRGAAVFSDPYGEEGCLLALRDQVLLVRECAEPVSLGLPGDERIEEEEVWFTQAFDRVLLWRGEAEAPLVWDPRMVFGGRADAFVEVEQSAARGTDADNDYGDGTVAIPPARSALLHGNRVWVPVGRDEIVVSDVLDYTRYNEATQRFKVGQGDDDRLVRLVSAPPSGVIVFNDQSIYLMNGASGDLSGLSVQVLSREFGAIGYGAVSRVGRDFWFLSEGGVFTISQTAENELQAQADPVSGPIQPLMDRINWAHAHRAQAVYDDNRFLLAVPMDGETRNNAVLVFDFLTMSWHGVWDGGPDLDVKRWVRLNYGGHRRLFAVNGSRGAWRRGHGALLLVDAGTEDVWFDQRREIETELTTRGYPLTTVDRKRFRKAVVDVSTCRATMEVESITDGRNEVRSLTGGPTTRDRTRWLRHGLGTWDPQNQDEKHGDPWREDYSVRLEGGGRIHLGAAGVNPQAEQRTQGSYRLGERGQFVQLRVRGTAGRTTVHGCMVEGTAGTRGYGGRRG